MKSIATLLFLFCYSCGVCQINPTDSSFTCMANWKKGEEKIFLINRNKQNVRSGKAQPPFNFNYEAVVTILDSTDEGYRIQWVFHLPALVIKMNPGLEDAMPVYEGLKMIFLTTKEGAFKELINWQEVKNAYVKMMEVSLPPNPDDKTKAAIEKGKELFNSKEMIESTMIPEIQLYYSPYGNVFTQKGTSTAASLVTPFTEEPLPAIFSEKITEMTSQSDLIRFSIEQKIDKGNTGILSDDLLKKLGIQEDSVLIMAKEIIAQLELTDHREYVVTPSTSWIKKIHFEKIVQNAELSNKESFTIVLK